jgi:hypothetical protein
MSTTTATGSDNNDIVYSLFQQELEKHNLHIEKTDADGFILVKKGEDLLKISLDNVRRDYERDGSTEPIANLAKALAEYGAGVPTKWKDAREHVFMSFYPNDFDFTNLVCIPVTQHFSAGFVYGSGTTHVIISQDELDAWKIDAEQLRDQAFANAEVLLRQSNVSFTEVEGRNLGYIETEWDALKGALLFSYGFKEQMGAQLGYPFYGIFPVRDFCYVFAEADLDFFAERLGGVVKDEYLNSGYPITTEILKFTQDDVEAIGAYEIEG